MIKAWNKDGKEVKVDNHGVNDDDFQQYNILLALISQEAKEIITKIEVNTEKFILTVVQK